MHTVSQTQSLLEHLASQGLSSSVVMRLSDQPSDQIRIWPYDTKLAGDQAQRPARSPIGEPSAEPKYLQATYVALIASSLADFDQLMAVLLRMPIIQSNPPMRIKLAEVPLSDLWVAFHSSGVAPSLVVCVELS